MVQWLRLHAPNARGPGSIPDQGIRFHMTQIRVHTLPWATLMAQWVKNTPAVEETQEMQDRPLGREDLLEDEMATHSSILAGKSHGQRSLAG